MQDDRSTQTGRLANFSDGVIAVIITIMVLDLKAPDDPSLDSLMDLWPTIVSYIVSYLFVAIIWLNHHHLFSFVRTASPRLLWINFLHLFLVSLLPFATSWMARTKLAPLPVAIYAGIFVLVNAAYVLFEHESLSQAETGRISTRARRLAERRSMVGIVIFAIAGLTALKMPRVGFCLICSALLLYLRPDLFTRHHQVGA
jgi:uncharacterized membrane protein